MKVYRSGARLGLMKFYCVEKKVPEGEYLMVEKCTRNPSH